MKRARAIKGGMDTIPDEWMHERKSEDKLSIRGIVNDIFDDLDTIIFNARTYALSKDKFNEIVKGVKKLYNKNIWNDEKYNFFLTYKLEIVNEVIRLIKANYEDDD